MSEFSGTRCDDCGKIVNQAAAYLVEECGWVEDDRDGHLCPYCVGTTATLEADMVSNEEMAVFGEVLGKTANAVLESPEVIKMKAERLAAYTKLKKDTIRAIRKEMKELGMVESDINRVINETETELDNTYNQKFNFKIDG